MVDGLINWLGLTSFSTQIVWKLPNHVETSLKRVTWNQFTMDLTLNQTLTFKFEQFDRYFTHHYHYQTSENRKHWLLIFLYHELMTKQDIYRAKWNIKWIIHMWQNDLNRQQSVNSDRHPEWWWLDDQHWLVRWLSSHVCLLLWHTIGGEPQWSCCSAMTVAVHRMAVSASCLPLWYVWLN